MKLLSGISTDRGVQSAGRSLDWIKHGVHEDKWLELRLEGSMDSNLNVWARKPYSGLGSSLKAFHLAHRV